MQEIPCAALLALESAGNNMEASMAIMAITTRSSIKVKPERFEFIGASREGFELAHD